MDTVNKKKSVIWFIAGVISLIFYSVLAKRQETILELFRTGNVHGAVAQSLVGQQITIFWFILILLTLCELFFVIGCVYVCRAKGYPGVLGLLGLLSILGLIIVLFLPDKSKQDLNINT